MKENQQKIIDIREAAAKRIEKQDPDYFYADMEKSGEKTAGRKKEYRTPSMETAHRRKEAAEWRKLHEVELKKTEMRTVIGTVIEREEKAARQRRMRRMQVYHRKFAIGAIALLIILNICSLMMTNAFADEAVSPALQPCYTSVRIEDGDSLWSIASRYAEKSPMDVQEYVDELRRMNQLHNDTIHAGNYLTVVYYK